jgi:hypothetical protein
MKGWEQQYNKICFICRRGRFAQLKKEEAGTSPTTNDNDYCIPLSTHRKRKKKRVIKARPRKLQSRGKKLLILLVCLLRAYLRNVPFSFVFTGIPILIGGFFQPSNKGL